MTEKMRNKFQSISEHDLIQFKFWATEICKPTQAHNCWNKDKIASIPPLDLHLIVSSPTCKRLAHIHKILSQLSETVCERKKRVKRQKSEQQAVLEVSVLGRGHRSEFFLLTFKILSNLHQNLIKFLHSKEILSHMSKNRWNYCKIVEKIPWLCVCKQVVLSNMCFWSPRKKIDTILLCTNVDYVKKPLRK